MLEENLSNEIHGVLVDDIKIPDRNKRGKENTVIVNGDYKYYDDAYNFDNVDVVDASIAEVVTNTKPGSTYEDRREVQFYLMKQDKSMWSAYTAIANGRARSHPTLSLDGVCWEIKPESPISETKEAIGGTERHLVTHLGGFGPQLREIVYPHYDKAPYGQKVKLNFFNKSGFKQTIVDAIKYMELHTGVYASFVSVAEQSRPHLSFEQNILIDAKTPHVRIKYWTKKKVVQHRRKFPCKPVPWTTLDQAHCNQKRMLEKSEVSCTQYLPASHFFREKIISNDTCIHNHKGLLWDVVMSDGLLKTLLEEHYNYNHYYPEIWGNTYDEDGFIEKLFDEFADLDFIAMGESPRRNVIAKLTETTPECPRPCTRTSYHFDVTYPAPMESNMRKCAAALAYFFVPTVTHNGHSNGGTPSGKLNNATYAAFTYAYNTLWTSKNPNWQLLPCSVVEFERAEVQGQVLEEYFLYGMSDLASNIGGTLGLWIGASVISIVQFFYLTCLEKMFGKANSTPQEPGRDETFMPPYIASRSAAYVVPV